MTAIHCFKGSMEVQGPCSTVLEVLCCRCGRLMGYKPGHGVWGRSYSYCIPCFDSQMADPMNTKGQYIHLRESVSTIETALDNFRRICK